MTDKFASDQEDLLKLSTLWLAYKEVNDQMTESKWFPSEVSMTSFSAFALEFIKSSNSGLFNSLGLSHDTLLDSFQEVTPHLSNLIISLGSRIQDCRWANGLISAFDDIGVPQQQSTHYQGIYSFCDILFLFASTMSFLSCLYIIRSFCVFWQTLLTR